VNVQHGAARRRLIEANRHRVRAVGHGRSGAAQQPALHADVVRDERVGRRARGQGAGEKDDG